MIRTVFDTNVLVSALLRPHSSPRRALDAILPYGVLVVSASIWGELIEVLARPKFDRYLTEAERREFRDALEPMVEHVRITDRIAACRDPRDDKFLEAAVNGGASCIVTGDEDLLVLHPFRNIDILTPKEFLERYGYS